MPDSYREPYKYGFVTPIENESFEKGLNEDIIRYMTVKVEDFNNEVASEEDAAVAEA